MLQREADVGLEREAALLLKERAGIDVKWAPVTDTGELDYAALEALIGPKTKLVAAATTTMQRLISPLLRTASITRRTAVARWPMAT